MQPIRVNEQDIWYKKIHDKFYKRKEDVQTAYTVELNEKVNDTFPSFLSSVKVDKLIKSSKTAVDNYLDFKTSMANKLESLKKKMLTEATALESHCNTFAKAKYGKNGEIDYNHVVDFDINSLARNDRTPDLTLVDVWAKTFCRHLQERKDMEDGNKLVLIIAGLDELEILAREGFQCGLSIDDAIVNMDACCLQAGISRAKKPQDVVLPTLLGHDKT